MYDRRKSIGGSDAVMIWAGQWADLYDQKASSDRLSASLPAEVGKACEALNRRWFIQETQTDVFHVEEWADAPFANPNGPDWQVFSPDGLIDSDPNKFSTYRCVGPRHHLERGDVEIFEAKAVITWWQPQNLIRKYMPQLQHGMMVLEARKAWLSVIYLNNKWERYEIPFDPIFAEQLLEKEELFMWFLENETRPPDLKRKRKT